MSSITRDKRDQPASVGAQLHSNFLEEDGHHAAALQPDLPGCGQSFATARTNAKTCTSTCRQRLRHGAEFAYLARLGKYARSKERAYHRSRDLNLQFARDIVAAGRNRREQMNKSPANIASDPVLNAEQQRKRRRVLDAVMAFVKLLAKQGSEITAETVAAVWTATTRCRWSPN